MSYTQVDDMWIAKGPVIQSVLYFIVLGRRLQTSVLSLTGTLPNNDRQNLITTDSC